MQAIEILDIVYAYIRALSFLSQKFVATKWVIYKGILACPNQLS